MIHEACSKTDARSQGLVPQRVGLYHFGKIVVGSSGTNRAVQTLNTGSLAWAMAFAGSYSYVAMCWGGSQK